VSVPNDRSCIGVGAIVAIAIIVLLIILIF
jgi:hypothetical protein